jgi:hypothetical protein
MIWVAAPFVLIGVSLLASGSRLFWLEWQYHTRAVRIHGTVLNKWRSSSRSGSFGGTTGIGSGPTGSAVSNMIRYKYRSAQGEDWEDEDSIGSSYWERLHPGDSLTVFYLPKLPHHSRLYMGVRAFMPAILFLLGGMFTFMGGIVEFFLVGELWKKYTKRHEIASPHPSHR